MLLEPEEDLIESEDRLIKSEESCGHERGPTLRKKEITGYENFTRLLQISLTFFVLFCAFFTC